MKIFDVSLPLLEKTIVYPGNPGVRIRGIKTKTSVISEITFGSHTGTHADAPRHVFPKGAGVDRLSLDVCIGSCRVLDCARARDCVRVADLRAARIRKGERILIKTQNSRRGFRKFYDDYVYLHGEAARFLAERGVVLFGIDYLSIKQRGSSDNRPHTELLRRRVVVFEGLDLSRVRPGRYQFIGLPLKFVGLDGAPARAVLVGA